MPMCFPCRPADKAVLVKAYREKPQPNQEEIAEITSRVSMNKQAVRVSSCTPSPQGYLFRRNKH